MGCNEYIFYIFLSSTLTSSLVFSSQYDKAYVLSDFKYKIGNLDQNRIFKIIQHISRLWYYHNLLLDSIPNHIEKLKGSYDRSLWILLPWKMSNLKNRSTLSLGYYSKEDGKIEEPTYPYENRKDHQIIPKLWYTRQKLSKMVSSRVPLKWKGWSTFLPRQYEQP